MKQALLLARDAAEKNDVPVGAVIVHKNEIIARAQNSMNDDQCFIKHAEIKAIEMASTYLKTPYLIDCDLYVTLEPCCMCAGAIAHSRINRLYFGAYDPKGGFVEHQAKVFNYTHHKPDVYGGILESEATLILKDFFKKKR